MLDSIRFYRCTAICLYIHILKDILTAINYLTIINEASINISLLVIV